MQTAKFHNCNAHIDTYAPHVRVFVSYNTPIVVTIGTKTYLRENWRGYSRTTTQQVARYMREQMERYATCDELSELFAVSCEEFYTQLNRATA